MSLPTTAPDKLVAMHKMTVQNNNNKYYIIAYWENERIGVRAYGKLRDDISVIIASVKRGEKPISGQWKIDTNANWWDYEDIISSKTNPNGSGAKRDGRPYTILPLADDNDVAVVKSEDGSDEDNTNLLQAVNVEQSVLDFVSLVTNSATNYVNDYLSGDIAALSLQQINKANDILLQASPVIGGYKQSANDNRKLLNIVEDYYNTIPTVLPKDTRSNSDQLVSDWVKQANNGEIEDRLEQLKTLILLNNDKSVLNTQINPVLQTYLSLGIVMKEISSTDDVFNDVNTYWQQRGPSGEKPNGRISKLFAVTIPTEREAFMKEQFGSERVWPLFHGTRLVNTQHILRTGLKIKRVADNGSRFGRGNYHSTSSIRSWQYTDKSTRKPNIMFLCHVKIGKSYRNDGMDSSLTQAPNGYHSVLGEGSWGGLGDEYVTYRESQSTISYIMTVDY